MKIIIPALLLILLTSCTKESLTTPAASQTPASTTAVSYKDNNISVVDFKAQPDDKNIAVSFTTLYEKNVVRVEILKGLTANNLCSIYKQEVDANSYAAITYSTSDVSENKAAAVFYIVKYTLADGDWGYTPVFKLAL